MSRFTRLCAFLFVLFFSGNLMAGYPACSTTGKYTSCNPGYYMSDCGTTSANWNGQSVTPSSGNSCKSCPDGYTCAGGDVCPVRNVINCAAGKYIKANTTTCTACLPGNYCPGITTDSVTSTSSDRGIIQCPAGSYCPAGSGEPKACPTNYGNSAAGSDEALDCYTRCGVGAVVTAPMTPCVTPAGAWYSTTAHNVYYGKISPIGYCPLGSDSRDGVTSLHDQGTDCVVTVSAGYSSTVTTSTARYIRISSETGAFPLTEIQAYYSATKLSLALGSSMTNGANALDDSLMTQASVTTVSDVGAYATFDLGSAQMITNIMFALGNVTDARNIVIAISSDNSKWTTVFNQTVYGVLALPGVLQNVPVNTRTKTYCAAGTYNGETTVPATNGVTCTACPALGGSNWTWNMSKGATKYSQCKRTGVPDGCSAGKVTDTATSETTWGSRDLIEWAEPGSVQLLAKAGYQIDVTNLKCIICPNGHYSRGSTSSCAPVAAGYYATGAATSSDPSSTDCVTGTCGKTDSNCYSTGGATTSCQYSCAAEAGSYYPYSASGATSINKCYSASISGEYVRSAGGAPITCPIGSYAEKHTVYYGSTSTCTPCPAGTTTGTAGAYGKFQCSTECNGASRTHSWATPSFSNSTGTISNLCKATSCKAGSALGTTGQCNECPGGHYQPVEGYSDSVCSITPAGYYNNETGATEPVPCPAGQWSYSQSKSCTTLPAGYWNNGCGTNNSGSVCDGYLGGEIDAGYWGEAGATKSTGSGMVDAGYWNNGGGTSATPTASGNGCVSGKECGTIDAGYWSDGGAKTATPTTTSDCVGGNCGLIHIGFYSTGGGKTPRPYPDYNQGDACLEGFECGYVAAGYYSNGGGTSATPTGFGDGCVGQWNNNGTMTNHICGKVNAGYYSTGGAITPTPTALDCHGYDITDETDVKANRCGMVDAGYYSSGGGTSATPTAVGNGCLTGFVCGGCPTGYDDNTDQGKTAVDQCQISCAAGTAVVEKNKACAVLSGGKYKTGTALVNYGSLSPTATDKTSGWAVDTVYSCPSSYGISGTTAANHDARTDCTISCPAGTQVASANATCTTPSGTTWYTSEHSVVAGSTSGTNVKTCVSGYTTPNTTTRTDHDAVADCKISCEAGYYVPNAGQGCKVCTAGKYCSAVNGITQTATTDVTGDVSAGYWSASGAKTATPATTSDCVGGNCGMIDPGYWGVAGATTATGSGMVNAGYYNLGGGTSATPEVRGKGCVNVSTTQCGTVAPGYWGAAGATQYGGSGAVAPGYYSTGGATSRTPSASGCAGKVAIIENGKLMGASDVNNTCGQVQAGYWNNACGINATGGVCSTSYQGGIIAAGYWGTAGATDSVGSGRIAPGYYSTGGATVEYPDPNQCVGNNTCGAIDAGYWNNGGGTLAAPTAPGNGCHSDKSCGVVNAGYYSTGGGTSATPTAAGNGCLANKSCGKLSAIYYSNGGSTSDGATCISGKTCGTCNANYRANTETGKTSASQCQVSCAAGTRVATVNAACTSPAGGWFSAAHLVNYGQISPVNYCMSGYTSSSTSASGHDAKSDCVQTVAGGKYVPSSKINARYIKITSDGSVSVSGSTNPSTHLLEMQAFASSDGTGTNLLSGKGAVAGDKMSAVTNGNWTRGDGYSYGEGSPMILDLGSVQALGSLKFAMYTDGREYQNVAIAVSEDNTTYTTVFTANKLLTQNTTNPTGELVVLSAAPKSCAAGTSKASGTVALGNTTTCGTCANWTYSGEGVASCTACPAVESGYAKLDSTGTGWTTYQKCVEIATASPENCASGKLQKIPTASGATTWATATVNSNNPLGAEPGYYVNDTACSACGDNNHYCAGGTAARKEVQSGYYSTGGTSSATRTGESQCKSGTYCVSGVQKQCSALTPAVLTGTNGTFSSADGSVASTACRYTPQTVTDTECSSITANTVSYSGSAWGTNYYTAKAKAGAHVSATGNTAAPACALCAAGTYQGTNGSSATTCTSADKGYYVAGEGATSQTKCVMGSYTDTTGQSACKACAGGKTNSADGATSCTATCSNATGVEGWETPVWGTDNKMTNLCTIKATAGCSANYYKNSNACSTCASGTNSKYTLSAAGTTTVNNCYLNTTAKNFVKTPGAGQTTCEKGNYCPGSVKVYYGGTASDTHPTTGGSTQCPANSYCVAGVSAAAKCSEIANTNGFYPNSTAGSDEAADCKTNSISGSYVVANASSATQCAGGTYKGSHQVNYGSSSSCSDCTAGNYCPKGASSQTSCATVGGKLYVNSAVKSDAAEDCYIALAATKYLASATSTSVSSCTKGNYCAGGNFYYKSGATNQGLTQCPANSYCVAGVSAAVACSTLVGGLYKNSNAGSDEAEDCNFTTTGGTYLSEDGVVTDCEARYYCPATKLNYPSTGGRYNCPDPTVSANVDAIADVAWLSSACPDATTSNSSIVSTNWQSWGNTKLSAKSQCPAIINIDTPCTQFQIQSAKFNTTTGKYDADTVGSSRIASTVKAGYYFTEPYKADYCTNAPTALMYYKTAAKCTANSYCPGATVPRCDSGKHTYGEPFGIYACTSLGDFYTTSAAGAKANTACYGKTTETKYVANANDKTETTCAENGYCVGNATVYYGSTGGRTACVAPYGLAAAGSDDANDCYLKTTAGQYVKTAGAGQITCPAGYWCVGNVAIYKGGSVTGRSTTGGSEQCPAGYRDGTTGYSLQSQCTMNVAGGKYVAEANESSASGTCGLGTYKPAHTVTYGKTSSCSACTGATYAAQEGMSACEACPTATKYADKVVAYDNYGKKERRYCYAKFEADIAHGDTTYFYCYLNGDTDYGIRTTGGSCWTHGARTKCDAGYYSPVVPSAQRDEMWYMNYSTVVNNLCKPVESGYWSGADSLTRTACATGLVTCGAGLCANEAGDCGRKLHAGDNVIYLRSEKRTGVSPLLHLKVGDKMFYGNMSTSLSSPLKVKYNNTKYSVVNDNQ